ncbi:GFA family protein [Lutimaribacter marinistellae]|uniref:GFA family protein n=1 Tax=Lutimaribacter marinistellae TaxID=1820329 RepID=A0ABV7TH32_9RHOB
MITGECLCGTVRWRVVGPLAPLSHCHCAMCRKAHATPVVSFTACSADAFDWICGEDAIVAYASSAGFIRPFCGHCGSCLPGTTPDPNEISLPVGTLQGDPGLRGGRHIFTADKLPWVTISAFAETIAGHPPGTDLPEQPGPDRADAAPGGPLRGSCLCGAVAYELSQLPEFYNCHCSRCRRARAAAHTTNGVVAIDALRFTHGENNVTTFRLPGARRFGQAFCRTCGSGLPRRDVSFGTAIVPLGSLDSPAPGPGWHIFTASMAPWWQISDDLPRFPGARPT